MDGPSTPEKQVRFLELVEVLTPPPTIESKGFLSVTSNEANSTQAQHGRVWPKPEHQAKMRQLVQEQEAELNRLCSSQETQEKPKELQVQQAIASQPEGRSQLPNTDDKPGSDIARWLHSPTSQGKRRQRFNSFLHSLYPSNDEFNGARHPFYDAEEDGPHDDFIKYQMWDGHCPFDDDDYDPFKDPTRSTEVWQPEIGDEGIDNEHDLQMVLKARREHKALSERFNKRMNQVVEAQRLAGVKPTEIDMTQVLLGPDMESDDSDSDYEDEEEEEEDREDIEPAVAMEPLSLNTNTQGIRESSVQPTVLAKGIRVFGVQEPSSRRGRPRGSKNRKRGRGGQSNKRKRDSTYIYDDGSEDEQRSRKMGKKRKGATDDANADGDDLNWKAQTRAAARRASHLGMDGSYDDDETASLIWTVSETDQSSDSGDNMAAGATRGGSVASGSEGSGLVVKGGLLSLLASLVVP
ncbi:hypothetical protein F5X97DRAFT_345478 [Nemania serpens]|nr:hypothetical protein F5X97DRAFT_345478 [Nemania serpens]